VSILTGGADKPYALGIAASLMAQGVAFDFIGSDEIDAPELHHNPLVRVLNLRRDQNPKAALPAKIWRVLLYYARLLRYAATAKPKVFHILWNSKLEYFDRTFLQLYFRLLGKRLVFTAHNVNIRWRDGNDTLLNRLTLRFQYRLFDHLFVHTEQMKRELQSHFAVPACKVTVIPFGINSTVPKTALTSAEAKRRVGLPEQHKAMLFFGNIAPYKGLQFLVEALGLLAATSTDYQLIIAGRPKGSEAYWQAIHQRIIELGLANRVISRIEYVPDEDTEIFFKAADVLVLPYTHIFQSGVLFLGYNFGLPVVASDVGSLRDDIIEGRTGLVCPPQDAASLARTLENYFSSDLYRELASHRPAIEHFARERFSWERVGSITRNVYEQLR
jgi:glycosyltransferase involved in cell wall biosynthesis